MPPRLPVNGKRSRRWSQWLSMAVDAPPPLRCDGQVSSTTHGCALNGKTQLGNILTPEPSHARPTCPPHVPRVRSAFLMTLARAIRTVVRLTVHRLSLSLAALQGCKSPLSAIARALRDACHGLGSPDANPSTGYDRWQLRCAGRGEAQFICSISGWGGPLTDCPRGSALRMNVLLCGSAWDLS